uniref:Major facilitator superfamily (MFS) profile domain-containing protein n=1 Tax=Calidris pygmaea TaxID=425635 RepID=A0A8C3KBJ1_9CHAR
MIIVLGIGGTHLSGFQMSVINYTSPYIKKFINETWMERYGSVLHQETLTLLWSFIVSVYCVGGMIGCLLKLGSYLRAVCCFRKKCVLFNDVVLLVATLHTGFSRRAKSFEMILIGRFLEGIAAGINMNAHVQYAGEISPKKLRGFVNVTTSVFLALGKAVARVLGLRYLYYSFSSYFLFIFLLYGRKVVSSQSWKQTYTEGGVLLYASWSFLLPHLYCCPGHFSSSHLPVPPRNEREVNL